MNGQFGGTDMLCYYDPGIEEEVLLEPEGSEPMCIGVCVVDANNPSGPAYGGAYTPVDDFEKPSPAEVAACAVYRFECPSVAIARSEALAWINSIKPPTATAWNDQYDAMRHAYWSALMVWYLGTEQKSKFWADLHELGTPNITERCMNYHNNNAGRVIALSLPPGSSLATLQQAIIDAKNNGTLKTAPFACTN